MSNEWHKSSHSETGSQCVEVREHASGADVRDTVHREAGHLTVPGDQWVALLSGLRSGL
ncbi:DUF397 domain-containing protein [Nocardiopsis sp. CNS-639]|uniref:DUF397 domain-containing protein n=1 Tax=Nocardiopsis sp. CNS-639 TaxID=1169153 RepID=UPI000368CB8C|nr:DUF397 domain-containing protein [Nocardiopsis sp. CNS-639]